MNELEEIIHLSYIPPNRSHLKVYQNGGYIDIYKMIDYL